MPFAKDHRVTINPRIASATAFVAAPATEAVKSGASFVDAVLALRPALHAFAHRLTSQSCDAEDLVQDTILRALAARHHFTMGTNLKAWLFTIMRNSFNTRWRRSQREVTTGAEVIELRMVTPATQEDALWARQALGRLLHDLSPAHRAILILIPVRGASYEEAAQVCHCSIGTVKSRLNRARAALADLVDRTSGKAD
jgi:RNA polymerase sigma-70 factor (ECF subfamily)